MDQIWQKNWCPSLPIEYTVKDGKYANKVTGIFMMIFM